MNLRWLINPISDEIFVGEYWGKSTLRVSREDAKYYSRLLPENEMEFAISAASRVPDAVEILDEEDKPQRCHSHEQAIDAFRKGHSLRIDAIQRFSYPITCLCRDLEKIISSSINVNMYLSPGSGKRALKLHYDTHDVLVLQVYGNKTWHLYDRPFASPLEFLPLLRHESIRDMRQFRLLTDLSDRENCTITESFSLKAGDFLYLPRGFWHEAKTEPGEVSCHLTVGVQSTTYLELLTAALSRAAVSDCRLRESLPFGFATNPAAYDAAATRFAKIIEYLPQQLDPSTALDEIRSQIFRPHKTGFENKLLKPIGNALLDGLNADSRLHLSPGLMCGLNANVIPAQITFGIKKFAVPPAFEAACRFILAMQSFTVSELPGELTLSEKLVLVWQLASAGLLTLSCAEATVTRDSKSRIQWLPISFNHKTKTIQWIDTGARALAEPFFYQTVKHYKKEHPAAHIRTTSLDALTHINEDIPPSGFIFHISRCGSTLLADGLRALPNMIVVSEPPVLSGVLSLQSAANNENNSDMIDRGAILKGVVNAFGQRRSGMERSLVIKFSSWSILHLKTIRALWPQVPCVIIVRDPLEVAVSCLDKPPGWMNLKDEVQGTVDSVLGWDAKSVSTMTKIGFCARILGEFLKIAVVGKETGCHVVDYKNLTADHIKKIAELFGIEVTSEGLEALRASCSIYPKDPGGKLTFQNDRDAQQAKASDILRNEVNRWARSAYESVTQKDTEHVEYSIRGFSFISCQAPS
ncbi:MAG: cupin domain-containing protein [Terracidiphilus sp.]